MDIARAAFLDRSRFQRARIATGSTPPPRGDDLNISEKFFANRSASRNAAIISHRSPHPSVVVAVCGPF